MVLRQKSVTVHHLVIHLDGSPEDCLLAEPSTVDRWHSLGMMYGTQAEHDRLIANIAEKYPSFRLRRWAMAGNGRSKRKETNEYRDQFVKFVIPEIHTSNLYAVVWSFRESSVRKLRLRMLQEFKISPYDWIRLPGRKSDRVVLRCAPHMTPILENELLMILMMADAAWTTYRAWMARISHDFPGDMFQVHMVTDYISGDDPNNMPRAHYLNYLLNRVILGGIEIRYQISDQYSPGELLADNLAGLHTKMLEGQRRLIDPYVSTDRIKDILVWNEMLADYTARNIEFDRFAAAASAQQ